MRHCRPNERFESWMEDCVASRSDQTPSPGDHRRNGFAPPKSAGVPPMRGDLVLWSCTRDGRGRDCVPDRGDRGPRARSDRYPPVWASPCGSKSKNFPAVLARSSAVPTAAFSSHQRGILAGRRIRRSSQDFGDGPTWPMPPEPILRLAHEIAGSRMQYLDRAGSFFPPFQTVDHIRRAGVPAALRFAGTSRASTECYPQCVEPTYSSRRDHAWRLQWNRRMWRESQEAK